MITCQICGGAKLDDDIYKCLCDSNEASEMIKSIGIYTCTKFTGHYPVGVAAVIAANNPEEALASLNLALVGAGLSGDAKLEDIRHFDHQTTYVSILNDGNY